MKLSNDGIAEQLRKPQGSAAKDTAILMENGNSFMYSMAYQAMRLIPGTRVLEIGQAGGGFVEELFGMRSDVHYTGLDYSPEMTRLSIERNPEQVANKQAEFICGDIISFQPDVFYDVVFSVNTLYFFENPELLFKTIAGMLKPGGCFINVIRSGESMVQLPFTHYGFRFFESEDMLRLFSSSGFTCVAMNRKVEELNSPWGKLKMVNLCGSGFLPS